MSERVHLRLDGTWAACDARLRSCPRQFHMEGFTAKQMEAMPKDMLLQLLEVIDPPTLDDGKGWRRWQDEARRWHRDHDLPAVIWGQRQEWFQHGQRHRDGDKPAMVFADGSKIWYQHDEIHRADGKPAAVYANGTMEWYEDGLRHRYGLPAVEKADGSVEYWLDGEQVEEPEEFTG